MTEARLFAWGTNSYGQLGLGFQSELVAKPIEVVQLPERLSQTLNDPNLQIRGGGNHTIILNGSGELFGAGLNASGQVHDTLPAEALLFHAVEQRCKSKLKQVSCGWDFSLGLEQSGRLWGWGSNTFGQLGKNGDTDAGALSSEAELCSAGLRFSAHSEKDLVFVSGKSRQVTGPQGINDLDKLSCGQNYCLALNTNGQVFAWGDNKYGQCGVDPDQNKLLRNPVPVNIKEKIVNIAAGWTHAIALSGCGNVFSWGRNTYGQLGQPGPDKVHFAERVEQLKDIVQIATGSEHCLALDRDGNLFTWGWNEHGSCGNNSEVDVLVPQIISKDLPGRVISVGSGAGHSFAVVMEIGNT